MSPILKGELVARRCPGDRIDHVDVFIGWMSASNGFAKASRSTDILTTIARFTATPSEIMLLGEDLPTHDMVPDADLANSLTSVRLPGSTADDDFISGGALLIRATEISDAQGNPVCLAMQATGEEIDPETILEFEGDASAISLRPSGRKLPKSPIGMALSQIHRSPVWKITDKLTGPISTMRLDVLDECQELEDLLKEGVTQGDDYDRLMAGPARMIVHNITGDLQYQIFREKMIEEGCSNLWKSFEDEDAAKKREDMADQIIRDLLSREAA